MFKHFLSLMALVATVSLSNAQEATISDDKVFSVIKKTDMCPGKFDGFDNSNGRFVPIGQFQNPNKHVAHMFIGDLQTRIVFELEQHFNEENNTLIDQCVSGYGAWVGSSMIAKRSQELQKQEKKPDDDL